MVSLVKKSYSNSVLLFFLLHKILFIRVSKVFLFVCFVFVFFSSEVAQLVKNPSVMRETWVQSLGWEECLEKGMATHSSILAWKTPCTVWSLGSHD